MDGLARFFSARAPPPVEFLREGKGCSLRERKGGEFLKCFREDE